MNRKSFFQKCGKLSLGILSIPFIPFPKKEEKLISEDIAYIPQGSDMHASEGLMGNTGPIYPYDYKVEKESFLSTIFEVGDNIIIDKKINGSLTFSLDKTNAK